MGNLGGLDLFLNGIVSAIGRLLARWEPGEFENEKKYQESLFNFLSEALPSCLIRREYPEGGAIIDLYLRRSGFFGRDEVFFEVKKELSSKAEFNRLVGQLMDMEPKRRKIIVVLCGKTDPSYVHRLKGHFKEFLGEPENPWDPQPQMGILLK